MPLHGTGQEKLVSKGLKKLIFLPFLGSGFHSKIPLKINLMVAIIKPLIRHEL
jgi:hypothetical protein